MPFFFFDPDDLLRLVSLFEEHRLNELEVREDGIRIKLAATPRSAPTEPIDDTGESDFEEAFSAAVPSSESPPAKPGPEDLGWVPLRSPMVGTFYRASAPGEPNFVETGDRVEGEQIFGLIEAMKIYSKILCDVSGTVMEISASGGQMVQSGQVLGWILPDAAVLSV